MLKGEKTGSLKLLHFVVGIFLAISIGVFVGIGFFTYYRDLNETYEMAEKATSYLQTECEKFDNYTRGNAARSLQDLLDKSAGLDKYIAADDLYDSAFLRDYMFTEHISGIIILDSSLAPVAQADLDGKNAYKLWEETIHQSGISDIFQHPQKTYAGHVTVNQLPYDVTARATSDGSHVIFCYSLTQKPDADPYELTLKSVLQNNDFYKNPFLVITDGTQILSTNSEVIDALDASEYQQLASSIDWKEDQLTEFKYNDSTYYGLRRVYEGYYVYAVYDSGDVFSSFSNVGVLALSVYLLVGIAILAVQRRSDKAALNSMEKQLRIIDAISTSYSSTFLLHMGTLELEPIKPSDRLKAIYDKHHSAYDFLFAVCKTEVDKDFYSTVMHFLDLDTMAQRLQKGGFLASDVKDSQGAWYSVSLIPQKCDENGRVQAVLVATRDVTSSRQAEELSFKDKLTGLRNRNYMESRSKELVRAGDFPVSMIMADCNYLKRTNDTLGHESGDVMLQRVANAIEETIPQNCVAMRIGGDEFLVLCPQCSGEEAQRVVEEIKQKLAQRSDDKLKLSAAFGISTVETGEFDFDKAYEEADREMYRDKKASRGQE